ncbi:MAG TPA: hypothetical protein VG820_07665 [Fimbriimonadaceae bacterium]|nr:hypothetical protein [Fimbriimonadaceae bacterium]
MLRRGAEGARTEPVDLSPAPGLVSRMLAEGRPQSRARVPMRYVLIGGAAAILAAVALFPRTSSAAPVSAIARAVSLQLARHERVFKPGADGRLAVYMEQWGEPGKYALHFTDDSMEIRQNGVLRYGYWKQSNVQSIESGPAEQIDGVGVAEFSQFKLLRVEKAGPNLLRYVFNIHQDLLVDTQTNLPTERVVYNPDGSLLEVHEYRFHPLDDSVFDPKVRVGVPLDNYPAQRRAVDADLAQPPQKAVVAGTTIWLHAVMVGRNGFLGAVVSGGDPSGTAHSPLKIAGMPDGWSMTPLASSVWSQEPGKENTLRVDGKPARLEQVQLRPGTQVSDSFTIEVPVWRYDASRPLLDQGKRIGRDSRLVGWAEFQVKNPLRVGSIEKVLPNYEPEGAEETTGVAASPK